MMIRTLWKRRKPVGERSTSMIAGTRKGEHYEFNHMHASTHADICSYAIGEWMQQEKCTKKHTHALTLTHVLVVIFVVPLCFPLHTIMWLFCDHGLHSGGEPSVWESSPARTRTRTRNKQKQEQHQQQQHQHKPPLQARTLNGE